MVQKELIITVEVRDKDGKLYKDVGDNPIVNVFQATCKDYGEGLTQIACEHLVKKFEAVCKEGSKINIEIRYLDEVTNTYPLLYSYYGAEKRFIKH